MIKLNEEEQAICRFIAKKRYKCARKSGVKDARLDESGEFLDLDGFGAEMAFCKMLNLYPDFTISARSGSFDALTRKGVSVDVKQTKYKNGHLLATKLKKDKKDTAEVYCLMIGKMPNYRCAGWIHSDELLKEENLKDLGHGEGFALTQEDLKAIDEMDF